MKKIISLLSVFAISGTTLPTTIAASSYEKHENKLQNIESEINYQNNSENLIRNKRKDDNPYINYQANQIYDVQEQVYNNDRITNFEFGANPSDQEIINAFVASNNIEFMRNSITVSSRNIVEQWAQLTAFNNGHQTRVIGSIRVNYNTNVRNRIPNFDLGSDIEITRIINLENLTRNLGNLAHMTRLRDGITVQRLIL